MARKIATENGNSCLLAYGIETSPSPIQVSPQDGAPSYASLNIVVSNNSDALIYCKEIKFNFRTGDTAEALTENAEGINANCVSGDWQINNNQDGSFTATPKSPENREFDGEGVVFQINNIQVNNQVGNFSFFIDENSSNKEDGNTSEVRTNEYQATKFPYGFYVGNFTADHPMVENGKTVKLTWDGADLATYTLLYDEQIEDVTQVRMWTSPSLHNTTSFTLRASVHDQGETVEHYLNTTVIVAHPEITATSVTVSNNFDAIKADSTLFVKNTETGDAGWVGHFIGYSSGYSTLMVKNEAEGENGNRAATFLNNSSGHSTLVVENEAAGDKGHRAATFLNNSSGHSTLVVENEGNGNAIWTKGDIQIDGNVYSRGNVPFKNMPNLNIQQSDVKKCLQTVKKMEVHRNKQGNGFSAENIKEILSHAVKEINTSDDTSEKAYGINYNAILVEAVGAIKVLAIQNEDLIKRVHILENQ